jgi:hypothetical protein
MMDEIQDVSDVRDTRKGIEDAAVGPTLVGSEDLHKTNGSIDRLQRRGFVSWNKTDDPVCRNLVRGLMLFGLPSRIVKRSLRWHLWYMMVVVSCRQWLAVHLLAGISAVTPATYIHFGVPQAFEVEEGEKA